MPLSPPQAIIPVPPPAHTRPGVSSKAAGKYRQCVPPPALEKEFQQRSRTAGSSSSCANITLQHTPGPSSTPPGCRTAPRIMKSAVELSCSNSVDAGKRAWTKGTEQQRKRLVAPSSLISHISNHYQTSNRHVRESAAERRAAAAAVYKSSPSTLLPSPPTQRKPSWRETKSSRLRLNRVKAPSMSALNL